MGRREGIAVAAAAMALLSLEGGAAADNFYACPSADGDVVYTNFRRAKSCKLVTKGSNKPVFSRQTFVKSGGKVEQNWSEYDAVIDEAAKKYNLPPYLIKAVIVTESSLDPAAVSSAGAEGLMQLMPGTAADMYVTNSFDPRENILGGARYLRVLANMFDGDLVLMLAAYNAGHNRVQKSGNRIPNIAETKDYVRKVLKHYFQFKKEHVSAGGKTGGEGT